MRLFPLDYGKRVTIIKTIRFNQVLVNYAFMVKVRLMTIAFKKINVMFSVGGIYILLRFNAGQSPTRSATQSPPVHKPTVKPQPKPVDTEAQQSYYDLGLQHYLKEDYTEAKKAFQQVVQIGPGTTLGLKAQENLKTIEQILKTLREIESK